MLLALVKDGVLQSYPLNLREAFPAISFPDIISKECLPDDVVIVTETTAPNASDDSKAVDCIENIDGEWVQSWMLVPLTDAELEGMAATGYPQPNA